MSKPVAVLISDIHYNIKNLALADVAMRQAINKAFELQVDLIIAGDLHDTKANLRGECVDTLLETFACGLSRCTMHVLIGNHDLINEKGKEHALGFLRPLTGQVINHYDTIVSELFHLIPYQHDPSEFTRILSEIPKGSTVICHQGVKEADMGACSFDKSAVSKEIFKDYRVISGHYHRHQDIKCGPIKKDNIGLMSYIGSPYTISFSEANDGPKGFCVLYDDGTLEQVPTNLRKHIVATYTTDEINNWSSLGRMEDPSFHYRPGDLLWVKLTGPALELEKVSKDYIKTALSLDNSSFKLDKIPTDAPRLVSAKLQKKSHNEIMDLLIQESGESPERQDELKALVRKVMG